MESCARVATRPIDSSKRLYFLVAALASVTLDDGSRADGDVDIHGVEAESDLKKSHDTSSRRRKDADSPADR